MQTNKTSLQLPFESFLKGVQLVHKLRSPTRVGVLVDSRDDGSSFVRFGKGHTVSRVPTNSLIFLNNASELSHYNRERLAGIVRRYNLGPPPLSCSSMRSPFRWSPPPLDQPSAPRLANTHKPKPLRFRPHLVVEKGLLYWNCAVPHRTRRHIFVQCVGTHLLSWLTLELNVHLKVPCVPNELLVLAGQLLKRTRLFPRSARILDATRHLWDPLEWVCMMFPALTRCDVKTTRVDSTTGAELVIDECTKMIVQVNRMEPSAFSNTTSTPFVSNKQIIVGMFKLAFQNAHRAWQIQMETEETRTEFADVLAGELIASTKTISPK